MVQEWAHVPSSEGARETLCVLGDATPDMFMYVALIFIRRFRHHMPQSSTSNRHMRTCSGTTSIVLRSHSAESWLAATSASMFAR